MITIDNRKTNFPYSGQCHYCINLKSEELQECVIYGLDISDDYWMFKKDCPEFKEIKAKQ